MARRDVAVDVPAGRVGTVGEALGNGRPVGVSAAMREER